MRSYLLKEIPEHLAALAVEGYHKPGSLTQASGAWISCAGSFVLEKGTWPLNPHDQWVWLAVEKGSIVLFWDNHELALSAGSTCFLPGGEKRCEISTEEDTRCLWIALEGPLSPMVVRKMGALLHMPLKQGALPSQIYLAEQIVQVIVRHTGTADATYQLQHLLYGMIASHWASPWPWTPCSPTRSPRSWTCSARTSTRTTSPWRIWPPSPGCRWKPSASVLWRKSEIGRAHV